MPERRSSVTFLGRHPMATAILYVLTGALPLYLISSQYAALERDLGLSAFRLGLVTSMYFTVAALCATRVGRTVHRIGATAGLRVGACVAAAANVVGFLAGAWWGLFFAIGLAGVANAFMQVSTNVVLARDASYRRQGLSFGAKQGAIPMASMVAGGLLPVVGIAVGWRWPFVLASAAALVAAAIAPPVSSAPDAFRAASDRPWTPSPGLRWLAVGGACGGAAGNALSLFFVPSAIAVGISEPRAGAALAVASGLVVLTRLAVGWIVDRTESMGHREMILALGFGTVACAMLAIASSPTAFYLAIAVALLGSWGWPGVAYFTVVRIHPEAPARASGVLLFGNLTGTLIGPLAIGALASDGTYGAAWIFCAALSLVATVAVFGSRRSVRMR